ncbi:MAG: hypothetical protein ACE5I7_16910 [Candidatus Binatia bacterium]
MNRFSLLDLSTIEATQAGKPLLLHAVGGNKRFHELGAGCLMLPDIEPHTVAAGLRDMFSLPAQRRRALARASRGCYETYLTPGHFWERHSRLYDEASASMRRSGAA